MSRILPGASATGPGRSPHSVIPPDEERAVARCVPLKRGSFSQVLDGREPMCPEACRAIDAQVPSLVFCLMLVGSGHDRQTWVACFAGEFPVLVINAPADIRCSLFSDGNFHNPPFFALGWPPAGLVTPRTHRSSCSPSGGMARALFWLALYGGAVGVKVVRGASTDGERRLHLDPPRSAMILALRNCARRTAPAGYEGPRAASDR